MTFTLNAFNGKYYSIVIILLLSLLSITLRHEVLTLLWGGAALLYILVGFRSFSVKYDYPTALLILTVLFLTFALPYSVLRSGTAFYHYCIFMISICIAYAVRHDALLLYRGVRVVLYICHAYVVMFLLVNGLDGFPLENIIPNSSSNGITSYLIVLQGSYSALSYMLYRKASLFSSLVTLGICIVGYGRGSVIASFLILSINIFFCFFYSRRLVYISIVAVLIGFLGSSLWWAEITDFVNSKTKIGSGLYDSNRMEIHRDYFSKIDFVSVFSGADYEDTSIKERYNGNPHSSYIRAHHVFGLFSILCIVFSVVFLAFSRAANKAKLYMLSVLFVLLGRAATEPILFPTTLDVFYYSIVFCFLQLSKRGDERVFSI